MSCLLRLFGRGAHGRTQPSRTLRALIAVGGFVLGGTAAQAISLCVTSNATLKSALDVAKIVPDPTVLHIVSGNYQLTGDFVKFAQQTTLEGGYVDCNTRKASVNAAETTIDLGGTALSLQQSSSSNNLIAIDGLSLVNANPLRLYSGTFGSQGTIAISRARISGIFGSGTYHDFVAYGGGSITLENVLMDKMPSGLATGDCVMEMNLVEGGSILVSHSTLDVAANRRLCLHGDASESEGTATFANSLVWASLQTADIAASFMSSVNMLNTTFFSLDRDGAGGTTVGASGSDPKWANAVAGDYTLQSSSPAANAGAIVIPGGLPSKDIAGNSRFIGSAPDRGAYESVINDATQYSVISKNDSGAGSLRDAIEQANAFTNPATITFNIPGGCPQVITLASPLPQIISPIVIDGTSQPGSSANTDADAFDADLCVLLKPASGSLTTAFFVPSSATFGSLTLRGLGIGGFSQPVILAGGSNHLIAGNQFGGSVAGIVLPGATFSAISIGVNAGGSLIVGGSSLADRNVIGDADLAGINVQGTVNSSVDRCQLVNNLIGVGPNGNAALPNFTGINLAGSGCLVDRNRIVGNTDDAVWINGGSNNVVQRNRIGYTVAGNGFLSGAGVRISGNGSNNVVGAPASSNVSGMLFSNTIRYMLDGGVVINGTGINNAVRTNLIYDNGASSNGMDIDLGSAGPLMNDAGDSDEGANHLQNFPVVQSLTLFPVASHPNTEIPGKVVAILDAAPGAYRIDVYISLGCDNVIANVGRPHAEAFIGTTLATLAQAGAAVMVNVVIPTLSGNAKLGLTATDAAGNTSEIGSCFALGGAQNDQLFGSGFD